MRTTNQFSYLVQIDLKKCLSGASTQQRQPTFPLVVRVLLISFLMKSVIFRSCVQKTPKTLHHCIASINLNYMRLYHVMLCSWQGKTSGMSSQWRCRLVIWSELLSTSLYSTIEHMELAEEQNSQNWGTEHGRTNDNPTQPTLTNLLQPQ